MSFVDAVVSDYLRAIVYIFMFFKIYSYLFKDGDRGKKSPNYAYDKDGFIITSNSFSPRRTNRDFMTSDILN